MRKYGNYPSVTTVISSMYSSQNRFLQEWLDKPGNKELVENSSWFGNKVHSYIESFLQGKLDFSENADNLEAMGFFKRHFLSVCEEYRQIGVRLCEEKLISDKFQIGGTPDLFLADGVVVDFKTSVKQKQHLSLEGYKMQLAAYGAIIKDFYPQYNITGGRLVIGIRSTEKLQIVEISSKEMMFYLHKFMWYREEFYNLYGF